MMHGAARWCLLLWLVWVPRLHAWQPQLIGRGSCGAATCHGGLIDRGPAWHNSDSVWSSKDPHALAGDVLLNALSRRIVIALEPSTAGSEEQFNQVLMQRCASCHAPAVASAKGKDAPGSAAQATLRQRLADGVSCEACHGAASAWLPAHTLVSWEQKGAERFSPAFGMKDTESLASRTENCAGCHVGSRSQDGLIRDMNHDMIAAGHPALHFDMWQAQQRLTEVAHWDRKQEKLASVPAESAARVYAELRGQVLMSAQRLSGERMADAGQSLKVADFVPELSEFDCAACHHVLATNSPRLNRGSTGQALWHPWYTAGQLPAAARRKLHINAKDFPEQLQAMRGQVPSGTATDVAADTASVSSQARDSLSRLRQLVSSKPFDNPVDYSTLPVWFDELEAMISKSSSVASNVRENWIQNVAASRQRLLLTRPGRPLPLTRLMPEPWSAQQAEQVRRQLEELIAHTASGAQQ